MSCHDKSESGNCYFLSKAQFFSRLRCFIRAATLPLYNPNASCDLAW